MRKSPTICEIADACGITHATVSMALHNNPKVALKTREKIQQYAKKVGYRPNRSARQLKTGRSYTLGFVLPSLLASSEAMLGEALYLAAFRTGYQLQFMLSGSDPNQEIRAIRDCLDEEVDGLIIVPSSQFKDLSPDHPLHDIEKNAFPAVIVGNAEVSSGVPVVHRDIARAIFIVTQHLIQQGYDTFRLLMPGEKAQGLISDIRREEGFRAALKEAGIPFNPTWIVRCPVQFEEMDGSLPNQEALAHRKYFNHTKLLKYGAEMARMALQDHDGSPMGLVTSNDDIALGALNFCKESGLRVPEDVGIAGSNDALAFMLDLTSVRWNFDGYAEHIIQLLLAQIAHHDLPEANHGDMELIVRKSTCLKRNN